MGFSHVLKAAETIARGVGYTPTDTQHPDGIGLVEEATPETLLYFHYFYAIVLCEASRYAYQIPSHSSLV